MLTNANEESCNYWLTLPTLLLARGLALHLSLGGLKKSASLTLSPRRAYIYAEIELRVDRVAHIFMLKDTLTEKANPPDDIESITR